MKKTIKITKWTKKYLQSRLCCGKTVTISIRPAAMDGSDGYFGIYWKSQRLALGYISKTGEAYFMEEKSLLSDLWGEKRGCIFSWVENSLGDSFPRL